MNERFRQTTIGAIWPGPIAGPLPVNLFRILSPTLVIYLGAPVAAFVTGVLTTIFVIFYFRLLELTGGKDYVEGLLKKLPAQTHQGIENKGPAALFAMSVFTGVFAYAIFLKLLRYPKITSEILLITASFVGSIIWTGFFWGSVVEIVKQGATFAF
jgi:hypothetical protein